MHITTLCLLQRCLCLSLVGELINKHADCRHFCNKKNKALACSHCTKQANIPITEGKHKEMWLKTGSSYLPKVKGKCGQ